MCLGPVLPGLGSSNISSGTNCAQNKLLGQHGRQTLPLSTPSHPQLHLDVKLPALFECGILNVQVSPIPILWAYVYCKKYI